MKSLNLDLEKLPIDRALGMQWDTEQDKFSFRTIRDVTVNIVSSDLNPADIASRGLRPHERAKLKIWLEGPKFLLQDGDHWPVQPHYLPEICEDDRHVKPVKKARPTLSNKI